MYQVQCGDDFAVCLTTDGHLYTCGAGTSGQLGLGEQYEASMTLTEAVAVDHFGGQRIKAVALGAHHVAALGFDGSVFTWGAGDKGQLGHGSTESCSRPQRVAGLSATHVCCGPTNTGLINGTPTNMFYGFLLVCLNGVTIPLGGSSSAAPQRLAMPIYGVTMPLVHARKGWRPRSYWHRYN